MSTSASRWIRRNMLEEEPVLEYSEELGRRLTEPEVRFLKNLQMLEEDLPEWYLEYSSKQRDPLRKTRSIHDRPRPWRTCSAGGQLPGSPRKRSPKKRSPRNSPKKNRAGSPNYSTIDSGFNEEFKRCSSRGWTNKSPCISETSASSSDFETDLDSPPQVCSPAPEIISRDSPVKRSLTGNFNTYPRVSPSRKIDNINIVLESPKLVHEATKALTTTYTVTKNVEVEDEEVDDDIDEANNSHASFLIAEVQPEGVKTQVEMFAELDESSDECDENAPPSPCTRFFNSTQKSTELERIVQEHRRESGNRSLVQEIIDDLDRSLDSTIPASTVSSGCNRSFVKSMIYALESSFAGSDEEEEEEEEDEDARSHYSVDSLDSELAQSTSISVKSCSTRSSTPEPLNENFEVEEDEEDDGVYWIPCKRIELPRTSSLLSMPSSRCSTSSFVRRSASPGLSPIHGLEDHLGLQEFQEQLQKQANQPFWYNAYNRKVRRDQQLKKIDEVFHVMDSGCYSDDRSASPVSCTSSSSTIIHSADDERESVISIPMSPPVSSLSFWEPSPAPSISSSPVLDEKRESICSRNKIPTRRFVLKSYLV